MAAYSQFWPVRALIQHDEHAGILVPVCVCAAMMWGFLYPTIRGETVAKLCQGTRRKITCRECTCLRSCTCTAAALYMDRAQFGTIVSSGEKMRTDGRTDAVRKGEGRRRNQREEGEIVITSFNHLRYHRAFTPPTFYIYTILRVHGERFAADGENPLASTQIPAESFLFRV